MKLSLSRKHEEGRDFSKREIENSFSKLKSKLESFDKNYLVHLKHLSFVDFYNKLLETTYILLNHDFSLDHMEVLTSDLAKVQKHDNKWRNFVNSKCAELRSLSGAEFLFQPHVLGDVLKFPSLTKLVLENSGPVDRTICWSMAENLEHLDIYHSDDPVKKREIHPSVELWKLKLPKLTFLRLANVNIYTDGIAEELERDQTGDINLVGFPRLKILILRRISVVMPRNRNLLIFLLRRAEMLEELDLHGCDELNYDDVDVALGPLWRITLHTLDLFGIDGTHGFCNFFNRSKGAVYLRSMTPPNRAASISIRSSKVSSREINT